MVIMGLFKSKNKNTHLHTLTRKDNGVVLSTEELVTLRSLEQKLREAIEYNEALDHYDTKQQAYLIKKWQVIDQAIAKLEAINGRYE